ncbi:hypothetical protein BU202_00085 [Streptococcus cuniculi]|uniref:Uncharacterized protein n=1 Tax=Streptococcus cuniculi TaxID=1432788 RepID=A0A1Q8EAB0_9STRE|nr:hypothetical protein [Streptococcus cuniculi]OLF48729.1 hypothetical protein BU202_00085 [Streptococcus cuniculi]
MVWWSDIADNKIPLDWYQLYTKLDKANHLTVTLKGIKDAKKSFSIEFSSVYYFEIISESWSMNGGDFVNNFEGRPVIDDVVLVEIHDGQFGNSILSNMTKEEKESLHHVFVIGINFTVEILCHNYPEIIELINGKS